ncbi:MAG: DUF5913 domain-containing protein, partial [Lactobacillales bacterium]|nr:DUF5913 domain-containing protein [Lactobacillales bacterium]
LKTGDIIEIITSANSFGPSRDWLKLVKTARARNKIKRFYKTQDKELNVNKGREMMMNELQKNNFNTKIFMNKQHLDELLKRSSYQTEEDLYAAVGFGEISAQTIANRLTAKKRNEVERQKQVEAIGQLMIKSVKVEKETEKMKIRHEGVVVIQGIDNLMVRLSRCCNPVPGDKIVGYITKGRGISIHRKDCQNLANQKQVEKRLIEVEWEEKVSTKSVNKDYVTDLDIYGFNRLNLLNDVLQVISSNTKNIVGVNARPTKNKMASIHVTVRVHNADHLKQLVEKIKSVPNVYSVKRKNG